MSAACLQGTYPNEEGVAKPLEGDFAYENLPTLQKINKIAQEATQSVSDIKQRSEGNKVGKSTGEINTKLAENGFQSLPEDEQAKYNSSTKEEQINKVTELFNDKENFKSISLGDAPLPEGVKGPVVWNTARAVAYKDGDFEWFSRLATSPLGSDISESASSLSFSRFGKSEDQAEVATAARIKEATDAVKAGNPKGDAQKESIIKETTDQIKQEADKQTLEDFLKENNC